MTSTKAFAAMSAKGKLEPYVAKWRNKRSVTTPMWRDYFRAKEKDTPVNPAAEASFVQSL